MNKQLTPSRRQFLHALGMGSAIAGVRQPVAGLLPSVPRLNHAWIAVRNNGDADFVAEFKDDIQFWFGVPGVSKQALEDQAKVKNQKTGEVTTPLDLSDASVDIAPTVQNNRKITGTIDSFATNETGNIYTNTSYYASRSDIKNALLGLPLTEFLASGVFPDKKPYLTIQYPDGFIYEYPPKLPSQSIVRKMYRRSSLSETGPTPPEDVSVFTLPNQNYDIAIPKITHRNNSALAWSYGISRIKLRTLSNIWQLFSFPFYTQQAPLSAALSVAQGVAEAIAIEAINSVITQPLPDGVSAIEDTKSIGEALEPSFLPQDSAKSDNSSPQDYQNEGPLERAGRIIGQLWGALAESGSDQSSAPTSTPTGSQISTPSTNGDNPQKVFNRAVSTYSEEKWLAAALPEARAQNNGDITESIQVRNSILNLDPAESGFATMVPLAENEVVWSHLLASTDDSQKAQQLRDVYLHVLEQQARIAHRINIRLSPKEGAVGEEQYWQDLYNYGLNASSRLDRLTNAQIEAIQTNVNFNG